MSADSSTPDGGRAGRLMTEGARGGPAVTAASLEAFLARRPDLGGVLAGVAIDQTPRKAGASSGTVLFELALHAKEGTIRRPLVFRYDLGGAFFRQYELAPQFWTMKALRDAGFPAPEPLWLDQTGAIAGHPGMIMARVAGAPPSITPFEDGPLMEASRDARREMLLNAVRTLARLHGVDAAAFQHLSKRGNGDTFIAREVAWTLTELRNTVGPLTGGEKGTFYSRVCETLERVGRYLNAAAPYRAPEVAHGDANITNFIFDGVHVAALLDYELSHLGLGEADLGYFLAGLAHFRLLSPPVDGVPDDEELVDVYRQARGKLDDWAYARLMGEWRLATFAAMGMSRLPPDLAHVERAYWEAAERRMHDLAPRIVPLEKQR